MSAKASNVFSPKAISKKKPAAVGGGAGVGAGGSKQTAGKLVEKKQSEEKQKAVDDIDDIFAAAPAKPKASKDAVEQGKKNRGPDMEEVKAEAAKFRGSGPKGGRDFVDGLPVYSEKELEEEMGETAWQNFLDAAEPGLS